jgi:zinc protease
MSSVTAAGHRSLRIERVDFPNGLTLLLAPNDGIPAFCLKAIVKTGSRYEPDDLAGLASLAGGVLNEGTTRRTSDQISEAIEDVGAHLGVFGGYVQSGIRATALSDDLDLVTELAADLLRNPTFPEDRVRLTVDRRLGLLRSRTDQPRVIASELFDEIVFAGHPNHRPSHGYEASVTRITRDHLVEFHETYYHPNATIIALAGNFDPVAARDAIERRFGDWPRHDALAFPEVPEIARQAAPVERFVRAEKAQANVYLGHLGVRRAHPDYYALLVLDTILGSSPGFTSRIPRILRDEQGLAYTTFSNIAGSAGVDPGRFIAYIGTSPANLDRAVEGLRREIARVVVEPVALDELDAAKSYLTGSFVFHFQTNGQIAGYLVSAEMHGLGFDYLERYPGLVDEVTIEDVLRAARSNIDPEAMTLVVVGPVEER